MKSKPKPIKGRRVTASGMIALQATITPAMFDWLDAETRRLGYATRSTVLQNIIQSAMDGK